MLSGNYLYIVQCFDHTVYNNIVIILSISWKVTPLCFILSSTVQWWFWLGDPILYVYERVILYCRQFVFVSEIICLCAVDLNKWSPAWIAVSGSLPCHQMDIIALSPLQCSYTHNRTNTKQCLSTRCKEMYSWFVQNVPVTNSSQF